MVLSIRKRIAILVIAIIATVTIYICQEAYFKESSSGKYFGIYQKATIAGVLYSKDENKCYVIVNFKLKKNTRGACIVYSDIDKNFRNALLNGYVRIIVDPTYNSKGGIVKLYNKTYSTVFIRKYPVEYKKRY